MKCSKPLLQKDNRMNKQRFCDRVAIVTGLFLCLKAVLPVLEAKRSGKIVNVSSAAGRSMSTFNGAH